MRKADDLSVFEPEGRRGQNHFGCSRRGGAGPNRGASATDRRRPARERTRLVGVPDTRSAVSRHRLAEAETAQRSPGARPALRSHPD